MTTQTKTFIEPSDILARKFTCDDCGCTLSVPVTRDLSRNEEKGKLDKCPMCRRFWVSNGETSHQLAIAGFITGLSTLQLTVSKKLGFTLGLEIKPEEDPKDAE
jgi:hypothetical protein